MKTTGKSIIKLLERDGKAYNTIIGIRRYRLPMNLLMTYTPVDKIAINAFRYGGLKMILASSIEGIRK